MSQDGQRSLFRIECCPPDGCDPPYGRTPADTVIYAIGDIHGRYDLLERIQRGISCDARRRSAGRKLVVYLGDYFSRGQDSRRVLESARSWRMPDCSAQEVVTLKGNHEDLALRFLGGELTAGRGWFDYGGLDALADYGVQPADRLARDDVTLEGLRQRFASALPAEHLAFLQDLRVSHWEGSYYFVHGGIRPGVALDAQTEHDRMWIRRNFLESNRDHGVTVIHGHSISSAPTVRHNRIGIDTGAYASGTLTCLVLDGAERHFLQT